MKKINLALIGYGFAGSAFHLPTILKNPNYNVKYIMTGNKERQARAKKECAHAIIVTDYNQVLKDDDVDLVVLATSNSIHYSYTRAALLKGKHVVCEKPFVETYDQAKELFHLADEKNLILRVFHNRKYDGDILTIKKLIKENGFGKIVSFSSRFDQFDPVIGENWRFKKVDMGGLFYDLGPHVIHYAIDLFGMPKKVYSKLYKDREGMLVDDRFEITLYYDELTCYLGGQKLERDYKPKFQIVGTHATYSKYGFDDPETINSKQKQIYQEDSTRSELIDNDQNRETIKLLKGKHYMFYDLLEKHIKEKPSIDEDQKLAISVILIMEMAMKSVELNQEVDIKSIL